MPTIHYDTRNLILYISFYDLKAIIKIRFACTVPGFENSSPQLRFCLETQGLHHGSPREMMFKNLGNDGKISNFFSTKLNIFHFFSQCIALEIPGASQKQT